MEPRLPRMLAALVSVVILSFGLPALAGPAIDHFDPAALDQFIREGAEAWEVPGLAVAVVKDGESIFSKGFGVLRLGEETVVDSDTLFAIGSTTKAMTAAALAMLVDEGKVGWRDRVVRHLPRFQLYDPVMTRELMVQDLLTHNGGLGNADFLWYEQDITRAEIVRRLRFLKPATSMRSNFTYQNIMYLVAGELIGEVAGSSWEQFLRQRIFEPLEMKRTVPLAAELKQRSNVAQPHDRVDGKITVISNASVDPVAPAGSIWSSVSEMSSWIRMLLDEGKLGEKVLLSDAAAAYLFQPQALVGTDGFYPTLKLTKPHWTTYGLAWFQHDYEGYKIDFHTGSIDGMSAIVGLIRELDLGVVVLANLDHAEVRHAVMYHVFDTFTGSKNRDWNSDIKALYDGAAAAAEKRRQAVDSERVVGTSPSLSLEEYAGSYTDPLYGEIEVTLTEGLRAVYGPGLQGRLEHWNYDTFRVHWDATWRGTSFIQFVLDRKGQVNRLEMGRAVLRKQDPD